MRTFTLIFSSLLAPLACVLPGDPADEGSPTGDDASTTGGGSEGPTTGESSSGGPSSTSSADSSSTSTAADTGDTGDTGDALGTCVDAINFEGNPFYTGDFENPMPDGQPLLSDPPLQSYHIAAIDDVIAVQTQLEVWVAEPGPGTMRRIAGNLEQDGEFVPAAACEDLRVLLLHGITTRPDGSVVIADNTGNSLIELTDPMGDCTAAVIAGNAMQIFDYEVEDGAAFHGDTDGPGAQAQFFGVKMPLAVGDDLYVIDVGNGKIKRVAGDADRTVSTLFDYSSEGEIVLKAMTAIDGTLYVTGIIPGDADDLLWAIDLATGTREILHQGRGLFGDGSYTENMYALDNDGTDLYVATPGYIYRLSTAAEPLGEVAGYGVVTYYPTDLDVSSPVPVAELPIRSNNTLEAGLLRIGSNLYFTGNGQGVGFHLWEIHCG